jgi:5-methylcytosine-specific restriction endonuclease McrA
MSTLLLNADYTPMQVSPLSTLNWQEAMRVYFCDKYQIVKMHNNWKVRSADTSWEVPSIVSVTDYQRQPTYAKLTRKNVFIRDQYRCQYCGIVFLSHELTFDHVVPRRDGGRTTWTNISTACKSCNHKKGHSRDHTPMNKPWLPSFREIYNQSKCYNLTIPDPVWNDFLQWPEELLTVDTQKHNFIDI